MKISSVLRVAALALLLPGRLLAQQTFPICTGTVPDSKPSTVQETSIVFYQACLRHGFGLNNKTTKDLWTDRLRNWFDANGWLTK